MAGPVRRWIDRHLPAFVIASISSVAVIVAAAIGADAMHQRRSADEEVARLREELTKRDVQIATIQAQLLARRTDGSQPEARASSSPPRSSPTRKVVREHNPVATPTPVPVSQPVQGKQSSGAVTRTMPETLQEPTLPASAPVATSITQLPILQGKLSRRPGAIVFGERYLNSHYFDDGVLAIRTARKYRRLTMKVGVQDNQNAEGSMHFWIRDENNDTLFEGNARAGFAPVDVDIDISSCERVEMNAIGFNGQTSEYVRWLDIMFISK